MQLLCNKNHLLYYSAHMQIFNRNLTNKSNTRIIIYVIQNYVFINIYKELNPLPLIVALQSIFLYLTYTVIRNIE